MIPKAAASRLKSLPLFVIIPETNELLRHTGELYHKKTAAAIAAAEDFKRPSESFRPAPILYSFVPYIKNQ